MDGGLLSLHLLQGPELLPTCWSQVPYVIVNRVPQFDFKMLMVIVMLLAIFVPYIACTPASSRNANSRLKTLVGLFLLWGRFVSGSIT